ncbi:SDR family NAD(P)-dependent oxidoreductase, partial [Lachnoclostridium sp.]
MSFTEKFSLKGKVALITGASHGIGYAIAKAYATAGATIVVNGSRQSSVDSALENYKKDGIIAHGYVCDVTNEEQVK